ncbi:MAG: ferrous iron transport protein A [Bacilli bacterium]|nr:ferrous iron transport protein A [Bacilli bacterium]
MKTIVDLEIGETAKIINMDQLPLRLRNRYLDLGIAPGSYVKLINKVNFQRLYIIDIDDVELCLRKKDAQKIIVE